MKIINLEVSVKINYYWQFPVCYLLFFFVFIRRFDLLCLLLIMTSVLAINMGEFLMH